MENQVNAEASKDWFLSKWALPVLLVITLGGAVLIAILTVSWENGGSTTPTYFTIPVALLWVKFFQARKKSKEAGNEQP